MTPPRVTRRAFLSGAATMLATSCLPGGGFGTRDEPIDPNAHPLDGLRSFEGVEVPLPALTGEVTLIDFWASWCAPCRQAFRYLDQLHRTYQAAGLQVLGISLDEEAAGGRAFVARQRPSFPCVWDVKGRVGRRFGVATLPTTVLLGRDGLVDWRHEGFDVASHRALETEVRRLLGVV
ncbi:MAG: TlpA family protein disulfide reductase [Myxococcota bacterium]